MKTPDQEVSKAAPEATTNAHPEGEHAATPGRGPTNAGDVNCLGTPNLLDCSFMTGEELEAFTALSTCLGASSKIAALTEIKASFSARCGKENAPGGSKKAAPGVTISGTSIKEAVIQGVDQLVREMEAREDALARTISHAEEVIHKGATKLSRQWSLFSVMWKAMEKKNKAKQDKVAQREQELAAREAELVKEAKDLELWREELKI